MAKKRILLVEDEPAILKMMTLRLQHEGFEVITATDGEEALKHVLANGGIALILLDLKLPKLDGFQVCKQLKTNPTTAKIPVIVFTASPGYWQRLVDQCIDLGVVDWLKKPFRSGELLEKIRRVLNEEETTHG